MKDLHSGLGVSQSISPRNVTATVNGTGVDLQGFNGAIFVVDIGTATGTSPNATVKLQESSDNTTFTDVAAADLLGGGQLAAITTTTDDATYRRGYIGNKRYVRVAVTAVTGTAPIVPMVGQVVRGLAHDAPVA